MGRLLTYRDILELKPTNILTRFLADEFCRVSGRHERHLPFTLFYLFYRPSRETLSEETIQAVTYLCGALPWHAAPKPRRVRYTAQEEQITIIL